MEVQRHYAGAYAREKFVEPGGVGGETKEAAGAEYTVREGGKNVVPIRGQVHRFVQFGREVRLEQLPAEQIAKPFYALPSSTVDARFPIVVNERSVHETESFCEKPTEYQQIEVVNQHPQFTEQKQSHPSEGTESLKSSPQWHVQRRPLNFPHRGLLFVPTVY